MVAAKCIYHCMRGLRGVYGRNIKSLVDPHSDKRTFPFSRQLGKREAIAETDAESVQMPNSYTYLTFTS